MKPVYLSILADDRPARDRIVALDGAVEWVEMPGRRPCDGTWRMATRARLLNCAGVIILLAAESEESAHQQWVARCAATDRRPTLLVAAAPPPPVARPFTSWPLTPLTDEAITSFLATLRASA